MTSVRFLAVWVICVLLQGCATQTYAPDQAPEYVVIRDFTPMYRLGPMQARGPDASLKVNTRVKLLRQEMGYSLVQLEDERTGYVANENLAVAPPRPPEPKVSEFTPDSPSPGSRSRRGKPSSPAYQGEQLNDIPLPDLSVPPPDLNIAPEDISAPTPAPEAPVEKPKFRI